MSSFIVSSGQLLKALEQIKGALGTSALIPTQECFLLELRGSVGELHLTASDLQVRLSTKLDVEAVEDASMCVPGRLLLDTLKHMADQPTTFTIESVTHGYMLLLKSATSERRIAGEDARGYPQPKELEPLLEHKMRAGGLQRALAKTVDFCDPASGYPVWTGVSIRFAPKCLELAASDGQGALVRYQQKYDSDTIPNERQVVVPGKALRTLMGLLPKSATPVWISVSDSQFGVAVQDGVTFTCRLIDQAYVLYNNAIPKDLPQQITTGRVELQTSLRGLHGYVNDKTQAACFDLQPTGCTLYADDMDRSNQAREVLPGEFTGEGLKAGFRLPNLLVALGVLDGEQVSLSMSSGHLPAMLTPTVAIANERIQVILLPLAITL